MDKKINQENYQFLTDTLAGLGFGDHLNEELRTKMTLGLEQFSIVRDKVINDTDYTRLSVNFEKGKKEEYQNRTFLNRIKATSHKANREEITGEFKIFKKMGFTVNEMENLLEGRPVFRERNLKGEKDPKWYRLDTNNLNEQGIAPIISYPENVVRINVGRELDKINISWKDNYERNDAILDIQSGNRISATARNPQQNGRFEAIFVEMSAQIGSGLAVINKEGEVIKYTNAQTQSMKVVNEDGGQAQINQQAAAQTDGFKVVDLQQEGSQKVSETTKQVMEAVNNPEKQNRGRGQKAG